MAAEGILIAGSTRPPTLASPICAIIIVSVFNLPTEAGHGCVGVATDVMTILNARPWRMNLPDRSVSLEACHTNNDDRGHTHGPRQHVVRPCCATRPALYCLFAEPVDQPGPGPELFYEPPELVVQVRFVVTRPCQFLAERKGRFCTTPPQPLPLLRCSAFSWRRAIHTCGGLSRVLKHVNSGHLG